MSSVKSRVTQYITRAERDHPAILAGRLGVMDRLEVEAYGVTPRAGLEISYRFAEKCWSGIYGGRVILMFGVGSLAKIYPGLPAASTAGVGVPWLLGTGAYRDCRKTFLRLSREIVGEMHDLFPVLRNFVAVENKASVRWLKWLGFRMVETRKNFNNSGRDFYLFESVRKEE